MLMLLDLFIQSIYVYHLNRKIWPHFKDTPLLHLKIALKWAKFHISWLNKRISCHKSKNLTNLACVSFKPWIVIDSNCRAVDFLTTLSWKGKIYIQTPQDHTLGWPNVGQVILKSRFVYIIGNFHLNVNAKILLKRIMHLMKYEISVWL